MQEGILFYAYGVFITILIGIIYNRTPYVYKNHEMNHLPYKIGLILSLLSWLGILYLTIIITHILFEDYFKDTAEKISHFFENRK